MARPSRTSDAWATMAPCVWTTSVTPPARKDSRACVQRLGCPPGRRLSATAASTRPSAPGTSCCRSPTAATSRWSPRWTIRRSTARRSAAPCATAPRTAAAGWPGWSRSTTSPRSRRGCERTAAAGLSPPPGRGRPAVVADRRQRPRRRPAAAVLRAVAHRTGRPPVGGGSSVRLTRLEIAGDEATGRGLPRHLGRRAAGRRRGRLGRPRTRAPAWSRPCSTPPTVRSGSTDRACA